MNPDQQAQDRTAPDRFLIAAVTDRLIYGSETAFDPEDARTLLAAIPHVRAPRFEFGIAGKSRGGSSKGYAAGVGNTEIKEPEKSFAYSTSADRTTRAGQWKFQWHLNRRGQAIEIEQVMADPTDEGRGARIHYTRDGEPTAMDIRIVRALALLNVTLAFPGWKPWKTPQISR